MILVEVMRFPFRLESMRLCLCRTSRDLFVVCVRVCIESLSFPLAVSHLLVRDSAEVGLSVCNEQRVFSSATQHASLFFFSPKPSLCVFVVLASPLSGALSVYSPSSRPMCTRVPLVWPDLVGLRWRSAGEALSRGAELGVMADVVSGFARSTSGGEKKRGGSHMLVEGMRGGPAAAAGRPKQGFGGSRPAKPVVQRLWRPPGGTTGLHVLLLCGCACVCRVHLADTLTHTHYTAPGVR